MTEKDSVAAFRWLSLRGMLRLEQLGMKTRGGALRPRIAKELGLSPRASYTVYIEAVNAKLAEINRRTISENLTTHV